MAVVKLNKVIDKVTGKYSVAAVFKGQADLDKDIIIIDSGRWRFGGDNLLSEASEENLLVGLNRVPAERAAELLADKNNSSPVYISDICNGMRYLKTPLNGALDDIINLKLGENND